VTYLGNTPTTQSFIAGTDYFNGTGSATAFTLSRSVVSVNDIQATVNNVVQVPNDAYTVSGTTITFTSAPSAGTNNIYVRYLSTTTQSITPSQGTVSWSTLNADTQQDLGISFKNRIINGAMVIDQRNAGASVTPANNTYTLDRWNTFQSTSSSYSVQQNAGSVTPPVGFSKYLGITSLAATTVSAGSYNLITQAIEGYNIADLNWGTANAKTITVSFWVRSSLTGTFGGSINDQGGSYSYPYTYTISTANTWEQKSITIVGPTSGTFGSTNDKGLQFRFSLGCGSTYTATPNAWIAGDYYQGTGSTAVVSTNGATFYITGVMLEVGTQATTFDYRSYGTELSLCQRYYQALSFIDSSSIGFGLMYSSTSGQIVLNFAQTMRANATVTLPAAGQTSGTITFITSSGNYPSSTGTNTVPYATKNMCSIQGSGYSASFTTGNASWLYPTGNNTIQVSAEL